MPNPKKLPPTVFGRRLREARLRAGIPQDKLGVLIGLDEAASSARISRYESGIHQPPYSTAQRLAEVLAIPVAYLFSDRDDIAELILKAGKISAQDVESLCRMADSLLSQKHLPKA